MKPVGYCNGAISPVVYRPDVESSRADSGNISIFMGLKGDYSRSSSRSLARLRSESDIRILFNVGKDRDFGQEDRLCGSIILGSKARALPSSCYIRSPHSLLCISDVLSISKPTGSSTLS